MMYTSATSFQGGTDATFEGPVSYAEALERLNLAAKTSSSSKNFLTSSSHQDLPSQAHGIVAADSVLVGLLDAVGTRSAKTLRAPFSTPLTDTSAMDGYVVNALTTTEASKDNPLRLRVIESIVAGSAPMKGRPDFSNFRESDLICVEIMTGACFSDALPYLDSVVKLEDVFVEVNSSKDLHDNHILLTQPVKSFQHRRRAGSDFAKDQIIIERGTIIQPKHIATLASLGFTEIEVATIPVCTESSVTTTKPSPHVRIGVLSTGSEIVSDLQNTYSTTCTNGRPKQAIPDSNGPYITSNLRTSCPMVATDYLGIMQDNEEEMVSRLSQVVFENDYDIVITSGGVSKGRHDFVRKVIETRLRGRIIFHGVKIRPGAPVLLATFDQSDNGHASGRRTGRRQTVFFGAPGNPLAAAVALRFFVIPYILAVLQRNQGHMGQEVPQAVTLANRNKAVLVQPKGDREDSVAKILIRRKPLDCTVFWLARSPVETSGLVEIVEDQASYKLKGLLEADCWVTVPAGPTEIRTGDLLLVSPL